MKNIDIAILLIIIAILYYLIDRRVVARPKIMCFKPLLLRVKVFGGSSS
jgi:putative effector of murein hydrolase